MGPFFGPEKCLKEFILTWRICLENSILVHSIFSSKFMITCPIPILVQFWLKVRLWTKIGNSNYWILDQNRIWTGDHKFRIKNWVDQSRIFETSPSRENELLQTLFWTKKGPPRVWLEIFSYWKDKRLRNIIITLKYIYAYLETKSRYDILNLGNIFTKHVSKFTIMFPSWYIFF